VNNQDLVGEVVFEYLDRVITTPGDISMADLKVTVREYLAYACNLIAGWATTASLYGLADAFPRGSGQIKNYLAEIGAKPWQQESKSSLLSTLPLPTQLVNYLIDWYAVKQIPDGRNVFCCPSQPAGLTLDESTGGATNAGNDLKTFETEYQAIQGLVDSTGANTYPEMRRMLLNAGWKTYAFTNSIPVNRNGMWWDTQVVNMSSAGAVARTAPDQVQCNPQAGQGRRTYALSVYGETCSPFIERLLMPVYAADDAVSYYDRTNGFFNTAAVGAPVGSLAPVSLGRYNFGSSYAGGTFPVSTAQPAFLVVGQSDQTGEVGWADTILGIAVSGELSALYSEMSNVLETDNGSAFAGAGNETYLYRKIFRGESTTVASNRYKFGNTIDPNMTGAGTIGENLIVAGDQASLQRVYEAFLHP